MPQHDLVILGDLIVDYVARGNLSYRFSELREHGRVERMEIDERPGGCALNLALHARDTGLDPLVIGRIGKDSKSDRPDALGELLVAALVDCHASLNGLTLDNKFATGFSMIERDAANVRRLISRYPSANQQQSIADVESQSEAIKHCKCLFIYGYCIVDVHSERAAAARRAVAIATAAERDQPCFIVFELVPHNAYESMSLPQLLDFTNRVDAVVTSAATIRRFYRLGNREEHVDREMALQTLAIIRGDFPQGAMYFGRDTGFDEVILWDTNCCEHRTTGHQGVDQKEGHGDMLALGWLSDFFDAL